MHYAINNTNDILNAHKIFKISKSFIGFCSQFKNSWKNELGMKDMNQGWVRYNETMSPAAVTVGACHQNYKEKPAGVSFRFARTKGAEDTERGLILKIMPLTTPCKSQKENVICQTFIVCSSAT